MVTATTTFTHTSTPLTTMAVHGPGWATTAQRAGGLPMEPINALTESEDIEGLLFCGTDGGLYASIDGGFTWCHRPPRLAPGSRARPRHSRTRKRTRHRYARPQHLGTRLEPLIEGLSEAGNSTPEMLPLAMSSPEDTHVARRLGRARLRLGRPSHSRGTDLPAVPSRRRRLVLDHSVLTAPKSSVVAQTPFGRQAPRLAKP